MLSRPLYRFKRFDLAQVPRGKRAQSLQLQLRQWSPYENTGHCVAMQGDAALLWCWDRERVNAAMDASGDPAARRLQVLPESLFYPPQQQGLRLLRQSDGWCGEYWLNGGPAETCWWPQSPGDAEWKSFRRDLGATGVDLDAALPAGQHLVMQDAPWIEATEIGHVSEASVANERAVYAALIVLLSLPTIWYGVVSVKMWQTRVERQTQLTQLENQTRPLLDARAQAMQSLTRIEALRSMDPYPDQLSLMATVAAILPADGSFLRDWSYQDGKLKFTVTSPLNNLSSIFFIDKLQTAGPFDNVRALPSSDPKTVTLTMDLLRTARSKRDA